MEIMDTLRQLLYPAEFRIGPAGNGDHSVDLDELRRLLEREPSASGEVDGEFLRLLANETWRLERRLEQLAAADCDYIALGHVHAFRDVTRGAAPAFYSGAPWGSTTTPTAALVSLHPEMPTSVEPVVLPIT